METGRLVEHLAALAEQAATNPAQAVQNAPVMAELAAALRADVQWFIDRQANRLQRVTALGTLAPGASNTVKCNFNRKGTIIGIRGNLQGVALGNVLYTQAMLNVTWHGGERSLVVNGGGQDVISMATLFAPATLAGSEVWYPLQIPVEAEDTIVEVTATSIVAGGGANITPDLWFAFRDG